MPNVIPVNPDFVTSKELAVLLGIKPWMIVRELKETGSLMGHTPILIGRRFRWKKEHVPIISERFRQAIIDRTFAIKEVPVLRSARAVSDDCIVEVSTTARVGTVRKSWKEIRDHWMVGFTQSMIAEIVEELNKFGRWQCKDGGETFYFYLVG